MSLCGGVLPSAGGFVPVQEGMSLCGRSGRVCPIKCGKACPCVVGYSPVQEGVSLYGRGGRVLTCV